MGGFAFFFVGGGGTSSSSVSLLLAEVASLVVCSSFFATDNVKLLVFLFLGASFFSIGKGAAFVLFFLVDVAVFFFIFVSGEVSTAPLSKPLLTDENCCSQRDVVLPSLSSLVGSTVVVPAATAVDARLDRLGIASNDGGLMSWWG